MFAINSWLPVNQKSVLYRETKILTEMTTKILLCLPLSYFDSSSNLKMQVVGSFKTFCTRLHGVTSQKIVLFIVYASFYIGFKTCCTGDQKASRFWLTYETTSCFRDGCRCQCGSVVTCRRRGETESHVTPASDATFGAAPDDMFCFSGITIGKINGNSRGNSSPVPLCPP